MLAGTRRQYTEDFKREAVRLVRESAHPVAQVARDLGIPENVLYRWRAQHQQAEAHGTIPAAQRAEQIEGELHMLYRIEQRIHTLAQNVVAIGTGSVTGFSAEDVTFSPWRANIGDGWWTHKYWLATGEIQAENYRMAWTTFWAKLVKLVPRMVLVSQCYTNYLGQPLLIRRTDSDVAFVRWKGELLWQPK